MRDERLRSARHHLVTSLSGLLRLLRSAVRRLRAMFAAINAGDSQPGADGVTDEAHAARLQGLHQAAVAHFRAGDPHRAVGA